MKEPVSRGDVIELRIGTIAHNHKVNLIFSCKR